MSKILEQLKSQIQLRSSEASVAKFLKLESTPTRNDLVFLDDLFLQELGERVIFNSLEENFYPEKLSLRFLRQLFRCLAAAEPQNALRILQKKIYEFSSLKEDLIRISFEIAFQEKRLEDATEINQLRKKHITSQEMKRYCIVLQCFSKSDTLEEVLSSLLLANEVTDCALIIIQDSPRGSINAEKYFEGYKRVSSLIAKLMPELIEKFGDVTVSKNTENLGTALTCRRGIDIAVLNYKNFMFIEDDCILSADAISFFKAATEKISANGEIWFASCETPFFDIGSRSVEPDVAERVRQISKINHIENYYTLKDFVPSTCFISNSEIWQKAKEFRCMPRGPESLSQQLKKWEKRTLLPALPRASDVGMSHRMGYSTGKKGEGKVKEKKNVLILSETDARKPLRLKQISPEFGGKLYKATSILNERAICELLSE